MDRKAWFCPSCQKHHAPHVETCPTPVDLIGRPAPAHWPRYDTTPVPWQNPIVTTCAVLNTDSRLDTHIWN